MEERSGEGGEDEKLTAAVGGSLQLAAQLGLSSIALPALSTGIFGFPKLRAARVILAAILGYFDHNPGAQLKLVRLVLFDPATVQPFLEVWDQDDHLAA